MKIQAKFPGRCKACSGPVSVGERVEWTKGERGVTHLRCLPCAAEAIEASRASTPQDLPAAQIAVSATIPAPEGLDYHPFQRAGIAAALGRPATLLGDAPGLGKTIQAVGVINADPSIERVIVVCPASLRLNWKRELETWLTRDLSVELADAKTWPEADVLIITWDIARKVRKHIDAVEWDLAVVDESHFGKSPQAQRTKAVFGFPPRGRGTARKPGDPGIKAQRRLALTGTPVPNRPIEIHSTLNWLVPGEFGSFFTFARRYAGAHQTRWGWDFSGASNLAELQDRLRSSVLVRRLKEQVLTELPPKRRQVIELALNGAAKAVADELAAYERFAAGINDALDAVDAAVKDSEEYAVAVARLRVAQGIAFSEISRHRHETAVAKIPHVLEHVANALESDPGKVIVFAHHHDVVDALREGLSEYGVVGIDGRVPTAERQVAVDRFQADPGVRVFVGSITAAGVGLTLTASSHVIFAELDWVPGNVTQAEDRAHRIGQADSVLIQHLVLDDSLDARQAKILVRKQAIADKALDVERPKGEPVKAERAARIKHAAPTPAESRRAKLDEVAATLADEQVEAIHEGLRHLSSACDGAQDLDGVGFNKLDTRLGHDLAGAPRLSRRQAALGLKLVNKYRRQLGEDLVGRALRGPA